MAKKKYDIREFGEKDPLGVVEMYPTLEAFREHWFRGKILIELVHSLVTFEDYDLYEHCEIIQQEIDKYTDRMLGVLIKTKKK